MRRILILAVTLLAGCSTVQVTVSGNNNTLSIEQPRTVTTSPSLDGNSVPISAIPK